jgi:hypothetical protein
MATARLYILTHAVATLSLTITWLSLEVAMFLLLQPKLRPCIFINNPLHLTYDLHSQLPVNYTVGFYMPFCSVVQIQKSGDERFAGRCGKAAGLYSR